MFDFYNTLKVPGRGLRLIERESFFVDLIVNFNEIQHSTWLGTFWNYVYKYTQKVNIQKTLVFSAPACTFPPGLITDQVLFWYPRVIVVQLLSYLESYVFFQAACINHFTGVLDFYQKYHRSTWFLPEMSSEYLISISLQNSVEYRISLHLPELHRSTLCIPDFLHLPELHWSTLCISDFLISTRTSSEYFMYTRFPYV